MSESSPSGELRGLSPFEKVCSNLPGPLSLWNVCREKESGLPAWHLLGPWAALCRLSGDWADDQDAATLNELVRAQVPVLVEAAQSRRFSAESWLHRFEALEESAKDGDADFDEDGDGAYQLFAELDRAALVRWAVSKLAAGPAVDIESWLRDMDTQLKIAEAAVERSPEVFLSIAQELVEELAHKRATLADDEPALEATFSNHRLVKEYLESRSGRLEPPESIVLQSANLSAPCWLPVAVEWLTDSGKPYPVPIKVHVVYREGALDVELMDLPARQGFTLLQVDGKKSDGSQWFWPAEFNCRERRELRFSVPDAKIGSGDSIQMILVGDGRWAFPEIRFP